MTTLRATATAMGRLLFNPVDPLPRQVERIIRVSWNKGFLNALRPWNVPLLATTALRQGLKTRAIHAMHAVLTPHRPALVDDTETLTYAQADAEMNRMAAGLRLVGAGRGAPVVLMMENSVRYVVAWFALARLGARAVHASYRLTLAELEYLCTHSGARVLVVDPSTVEVARQLRAARPDLQLVLVLSHGAAQAGTAEHTWEALTVGASAAYVPADSRLPAASENIVYTSGTTGKPKGAVRDFAAFGVVELARVLEALPFRVAERHLVVSPLYHSAGQIFTLLNAALGCTIYLRAHFDPLDTLQALSRNRIHSMFMVPTMIHRLLQLDDAAFAANPTPDFCGLVSGAAEFPQTLREQAIARFGAAAVHDFYGATELGWVTLLNGNEMLRKPSSVGRPLPGQQVRVLDKDGKDVPAGTVGLVYVRNGQTMQGYLHDAEATHQSLRGDWMTTEDLGYMDADGYLFLAGRERDMVKSGGMNVYPVEIEEVLLRHPMVTEVAVIGLPDPEWGERIVAVVVPRQADSFNAADVEGFARSHLAGFKIPRRWEVVADLPRNNTGKVMKKELRERFAPVVA